MDFIILIVATGVFVGMLPVATGVYGSILGVLIWYFCKDLRIHFYVIAAVTLFIVGVFSAGHAEYLLTQKDASPIIIDEIFGVFITLMGIQKFRFSWLVAAVVFLIFDGLKPFPASWFDSSVGGGLGIMLDDFIAGIYTLILIRYLKYCFDIFTSRKLF